MIVPYRYWIGIMAFFTTAVNYSFRSFFPIALLAMTAKNDSVILYFNTSGRDPSQDYGPRYNWSSFEEGQLLASYFYGFTISLFPGVALSDYLGCYWTIVVSTAVCAILTGVSPYLSMNSAIPLIFARLFVGLAGGVQYPALQSLLAVWVPPMEKEYFIICLSGNVVGAIVTQSVSGYLIVMSGWNWAFYFTTIFALIFLVPWLLLVSNTPEESRICPADEADYIYASHLLIGGYPGSIKPPISMILTSIPFLALLIGQFANFWGLYMLQTIVPKFLSNVMEMDLQFVGYLSTTPTIARLVFGFAFKSLSFSFQDRGVMHKIYIRKGFVILSHLIPGILFVIFSQKYMYYLLSLILAMAFNGAVVVTTVANCYDLAPNYLATEFAILNLVGSTPGFLIPTIVSLLTASNNTNIWNWSPFFILTGVLYILGGIIFVALGSVHIQPWNAVTDADQDLLGAFDPSLRPSSASRSSRIRRPSAMSRSDYRL